MTELSSGSLNAARYLHRAGTDTGFLAEPLLLIRRTFEVNSPEIVFPKLSSMGPSTVSGFVAAGAVRALPPGVEIDRREFPLSRSQSGRQRPAFLQEIRCHPKLSPTDPGVTKP